VPGYEHENDAVARTLSLEACIALSLRRLSPERRAQFASFAILEPTSTFTDVTASNVLGLPLGAARLVVNDLAARSLLETFATEASGQARLYKLHATVRARAYADLVGKDEAAYPQAIARFLTNANPVRPERWRDCLADAHLAENLVYYMVECADHAGMRAILSERDANNAMFSPNLWLVMRRARGEEELFYTDIRRIFDWVSANPKGGVEGFDLLVRCALTNASLYDMNAEVDPTLCQALVTSALWSEGQGVSHAKRRFAPGDIVGIAQGVAEPLRSDTMRSAIRLAATFELASAITELLRCANLFEGELKVAAMKTAMQLIKPPDVKYWAGSPHFWSLVQADGSFRAALALEQLAKTTGLIQWSARPRESCRSIAKSSSRNGAGQTWRPSPVWSFCCTSLKTPQTI
jgi:hypothetical protein